MQKLVDKSKTNECRISYLTIDRFDDFFKFNQKIYPKLQSLKNLKERFCHQVFNNPLVEDKSKPPVLVAYNKENQIIGQLLGNPFELYVGNNCKKVFYNYGFYVLKEYREAGIGTRLAKLFVKDFKFFLTVGVGPMSKNINLSFGSIVANMYKFIWFKNLFSLIKAISSPMLKRKWFFNSNKFNYSVEFPKSILWKDFKFNLVNSLDSWEDSPWDDKTLKFKRSLEFINWHFLKNPAKYFFYLLDSSKSKAYFVARKCIYREMNFLEIVDYNVMQNDREAFNAILNVAKELVKKFRYEGVITTSTNVFFDRLLMRNHFLKNKNPEVVMTNVTGNSSRYDIEKRDLVYVTKTDEILGLIYDPAFEIN